MFVRRGRPALLLALFVACALGVSGAAPAPDSAPKPAAPPPASPLSQLFRVGRFDGIDDPKTTLAEVLDLLSKRHGVAFEINEEAFRLAQVDDAAKLPVAARPIPKMGAASLDRVLRTVLGRLTVPGGAAYMVRPDHIEITTRPAQVGEVWGKYEGPYLPLVHADFEGRPLADALRDLSEQTGFSVVLDARAADKAKTPVTASFTNLPLDTAVRVLADMAGLKSFLNDNVLSVSTSEGNAAARPEALQPGDGAVSSTLPGLAPNAAQFALLTPVRGVSLDKRPLQEALQELLKPTGLKLVVDTGRVGDKVKAPVTTDLDGVTLDAALRLLADMANLQAVLFDNVVYLTTKENAAGFQIGLSSRPQFPAGGFGALGGGGLGGGFGIMGGSPR